MTDNKTDGKEKSTFNISSLLSVLAILISIATLFVTLYKERLLSHWSYFQAPVGLSYGKVDVLPNEYRDQLTIHNTSNEKLNNVVVTITNDTNRLDVRYELGSVPANGDATVTLNEKELTSSRLPRTPYEMDLGDYVYVSCDGYFRHEFRVQELGKKELLNPKVSFKSLPDWYALMPEDLNKQNGKQITCLVTANQIIEKNGRFVDTTKGTVASLIDSGDKTIYFPKDAKVSPGDLLVIQGIISIVRHPSGPEYILDATWAKSLSRPITP